MPSLQQAIRECDITVVKNLLKKGNSPDCFDETTGESILAIASFNGDVEIIQLLLEGGANPNWLQTAEWPINNAAGAGHTEIVELLLDFDADVDALDEDGGTALSAAAAGGYLKVINLLLEAGANPRCKDYHGKRPIIYAAENCHMEVVELLAPLSTPKDREQASFIVRLATQGPPNEEVLAFFKATESGDLLAVQQFLEGGGNVDVMDKEGWTAVFYAAHRNQLDVLKMLVEHGADVNHLDKTGNSPLWYSTSKGASPLYKYLKHLTSAKLIKDFQKRLQKSMSIAIEKGYGKYVDPERLNQFLD